MDPARARLAYADYLAAERTSEIKHEWVAGEARAMAGGTPEHGRLVMRLAALLESGLAGRPCETFSSDVRVRIAALDRSYHPDASVVCGTLERAADDPDAITNPVVVVEVLSDSTEARDRGEKRRAYQSLASLAEYVLVSQTEPYVEVWRRAEGAWTVHEHGPGSHVALASIGASFDVDALDRSRLPG